MVYTKEQILAWHEVYKDHTRSVNSIAKQFGVKNTTLSSCFKRYGLYVRPSGFRPGNCRGVNGQDSIRLKYLWLYKFAYKRRASRKGLEFSLSEDQFLTLVTSNCHYCGQSYLSETRVVNKKAVQMLTVDRKDSNKGYTAENCVPACKQCNTIKMDYSYEEFINKINKIAKHLGRL